MQDIMEAMILEPVNHWWTVFVRTRSVSQWFFHEFCGLADSKLGAVELQNVNICDFRGPPGGSR